MTERSVTKSLTPLRRKENKGISDELQGKDPLHLGPNAKKLALDMISVTRTLDPKLALLILKGAGIETEGVESSQNFIQTDFKIERED
jgi:hypothetical protein